MANHRKRNKQAVVTKYRKPLNINLGLIIFGFIFVYIIIMIFLYFTSSHITGYEVKMGSLAVNNTYRAIALRKEDVYAADNAGYINYYARECERVSVGSMVYTIDESGKLADLIQSNAENGTNFTEADMTELKTQLMNYRHNYSDHNFDEIYDFKYAVEGTVMKLANKNVMASLNDISESSVKELIDFHYADQSGIVVYSTDGLEQRQPADVTAEDFEEETHEKKQLQSNSLIGAGDNSYKIITDENWCVLIPMEEDRALELEAEEYIQVKFLKTGDECWGKVSIQHNPDGTYLQLSFTNSMINYASDRYLDVELETDVEKGLKIPNSSIVEKEFFLIPTAYITKGGDSDKEGFMRQTYLEDGSISTEFVPTDIYYASGTDYYVDTSVFQIGDYIIMPQSDEKYPVSKKGTLTGVYNMNKGYADFTQIKILYQNKEYSIVKSNTEYGLSVYDHIVLDGKSVNDNDFIF